MKEKDIQYQILQWLQIVKIFHYRQNTGAFKTPEGAMYRFGAVGSPDIVCVRDGRYIGIEVKQPGKNLSKYQEAFKEELTKAGGHYFVATCLEDVINYFKAKG